MDKTLSAVGKSILDFIPQYNDKILSLLPSAPELENRLPKSLVRVLMFLRKRPGQTATELGEGLGMTKANVTLILDELESRGLASRSADPSDRRKLRVDLTPPGRKTADSIARAFDRALAERVAPLPEKDRLALARHLSALSEILGKL